MEGSTMERRGEEVHTETNEARAGSTPGVMRYVLGISLALAVIAMSAVWIIPTLTQGDTVDESDRSNTTVPAGQE
jgi:hypothetical protein